MLSSIFDLAKLGLIVRPTGNCEPYKNGYFFGKRAEDAGPAPGYFYFDDDLSNGITLTGDSCYLFPVADNWVFQRWEFVPGPGPDDIVYELKDFAEGLEVVYHSYFGKPTIVDNWIFNKHLHPEWNMASITELLANRQTISYLEWKRLKAELAIYYKNRWRAKQWPLSLAEHFQYNYVRINNVDSCRSVLQLRRDQQQLYLINDWPAADFDL